MPLNRDAAGTEAEDGATAPESPGELPLQLPGALEGESAGGAVGPAFCTEDRVAAAAVPSGRAQRRALARAAAAAEQAKECSGPPVAAPGADGSLHMAAHLGSKGFVQLLLHVRADVNAADGMEATALHYAAATGKSEVVGELLSAGADVLARDARQQTPLHYAATGASTEVVAKLMASGADARLRDEDCDTPLSIALQMQSREVALAMVDTSLASKAKGCERAAEVSCPGQRWLSEPGLLAACRRRTLE